MPYHAIIRTGYRTWVGKEVRWRLGLKSTACRSRSSRVSCPCLSPCWKFSWRCRAGCMKVPGLHNYKRPRVDHSHMLGSCCSHTASCPTNNIVKHQWTGLLSPPYLSPCDCRMFCHRHKLRRGHRSQTPELRSCRMLAGSSEYHHCYQVSYGGQMRDKPGLELRSCPLGWCNLLRGHSGLPNTRSAVKLKCWKLLTDIKVSDIHGMN